MVAPALSVVIPTRNAAKRLPACLAAVARGAGHFSAIQIVVADCGSNDATVAVARAAGAEVVQSVAGRGPQLRAAVAASRGEWLLALHADTVLGPDWGAVAAAFASDPTNLDRAGYGRLVFDDPSPWARRIAASAAWRSRRFGLPYGDQGLLLPVDFYRKVGGYPDWRLMEDVALADRIGRHRLVALDFDAVTSADRYRRDGWLRRPLRNLACLALFRLGMEPDRISRLYEGGERSR